MKIHPNHEFNKMLKDGDAIVVTSKYLPSRYMYKRKETAGNRAGAGRTGKSEARAASRTEPEAAATAGTAPGQPGGRADADSDDCPGCGHFKQSFHITHPERSSRR